MGHLITMSTKELNRIQIIERIVSNGLNQTQAAEALGVTPRQMRRLISSYKESGAHALTSKKRGKPSNHRLSEDLKQKALDLIKEHFYDFGPTLAGLSAALPSRMLR